MSTTPGVFAQIFAEPVARKSEVKGYVLDVDAKPVENLQESSGSEISVWGWKNCKRMNENDYASWDFGGPFNIFRQSLSASCFIPLKVTMIKPSNPSTDQVSHGMRSGPHTRGYAPQTWHDARRSF
jgi:hypothetical protein